MYKIYKMLRDFDYEANNIGYDIQYTEECGGGIKCKNLNYVQKYYQKNGLNTITPIYVKYVIYYLVVGIVKKKMLIVKEY